MIDYENAAFLELTEAQTRQYIDADSAWRARIRLQLKCVAP